MLEIGKQYLAKIVDIEVYGITLEYDGFVVFVPLPEIDWQVSPNIEKKYDIRQSVPVMILRFSYLEGKYVGSIRRCYPNLNPYRALSLLKPSTILNGEVLSLCGSNVTIKLQCGSYGNLEKKLAEKDLEKGDRIDVVVKSLNVDEGKLKFDLPSPVH